MKIARRFSVTNFLIATSALGFQVFVLYPWHQTLDEDFHALRRENLEIIEQLKNLRVRLDLPTTRTDTKKA